MQLTANDLERAIIFATEKHSGQIRKGDGKPYIIHPIRVMVLMMRFKKSKNIYLILIACILHDIKEDCGVSLEEIAKLFGHNVAAIVEELTSDKNKIAEMGKKEYLLDKMCKMSSYSLGIKLGDVLDNLIDMVSMDDDFKNKRIELTKFIIDGLRNKDKLKEIKLTKTHKKIMKDIDKELLKYNG